MRLCKQQIPDAAEPTGFTLVELLVSMVVAMVILAGLYSNFFMQSRVQSSQSSTVDALEDLRLASQIMTGQLRMAANICWDSANQILYYQPLGAATMTGCATGDPSWGAFRFGSPVAGAITWYNPVTSGSGYQQLISGLDTSTGMQVAVSAPLYTVTLVSQYQDVQRNAKTLQLSFNVMPRD